MSQPAIFVELLEQLAVNDCHCHCQVALQKATQAFFTLDVILERSYSPSVSISASSEIAWAQIDKTGGKLGSKTTSATHHDQPVSHLGPIQLLIDSVQRIQQASPQSAVAIKFLLPAETGYLARSDIIQLRLESLRLDGKVAIFPRPFAQVQKAASDVVANECFAELLDLAVGAVVQNIASAKDAQTHLKNLQQEVVLRLSLPCILSSPQPTKQRLALIHLGPKSRLPVLHKAKALGINLVIVDASDSWVQSPDYRDYYDDFVAMDMAVEDDSPTVARIVEAVQSLSTPVDAIVSLTDRFLHPTAEAARILNLPSEPPSAYEIAVNKHKMRELNLNGTQMLHISRLEDLEQSVASSRDWLTYPLVVKPAQGAQSRGVRKVNSEPELLTAVRQAFEPSSRGVLIEAFIDGPEVDANFVLLNGEILFFELVDEIPCVDGFAENQMLVPSMFQEDDVAFIKSYLHKQVLQMGFSTGVMHVEARVRQTTRVHTIDVHGTLHSQPVSSSQNATGGAGIFIIEVNPRAPGSVMNDITCLTSGIDYLSLQMLFALEKSETVRALSQPFLGGTRCWSNAVVISTTKQGTMISGDIRDDLAQRRPDLLTYVTRYYPVVRQGQQIKQWPSYVALFLVCSDVSRAHSIEIGEQLRSEAQVEIV
ncbi:hypothetical protein GGI42DRAFT_360552 [Trichoderma sp. SZMC 28013]